MSGKSKFKRLLIILALLLVAAGVGYLTILDVTPDRVRTTTQIENSRFDAR